MDRINAEINLSYKEGLALVNGIAVMTGIGVLAHADSVNLIEWADTIAAVTLESILGSSRAFDEIVFTVYGRRRPNPGLDRRESDRLGRRGARRSAERIRGMINGLHALIYTKDAEKDRAFFRDVLGLPNVDTGGG